MKDKKLSKKKKIIIGSIIGVISIVLIAIIIAFNKTDKTTDTTPDTFELTKEFEDQKVFFFIPQIVAQV